MQRTHPDKGGTAAAFVRVRQALDALLGTGPKRRAAVRPTPTHPDPIVVPVSPAMLRVGAKVTVPIVRWKACGPCEGRGAVPGRRGKCSECDGAGQAPQGRPAYVMPCRPCGATGRALVECQACNGSGRRLLSLQTTIRIKPDTNNGTVLRVSTLDGPVYVQLKSVNIRR